MVWVWVGVGVGVGVVLEGGRADRVGARLPSGGRADIVSCSEPLRLLLAATQVW